MARIHEGGSMMFDAIAYGQPHVGTMTFLRNQFENLSPALVNAGEAFIAAARDAYEAMSGSHAMRTLRAASRALNSLWQPNEVRPLYSIGEFQHAPPVMQRWLMAEPETRRLYQAQRIDGFAETYLDQHPGTVGETHYDYRRAMDGLLVFDDSGEDLDYYIDQYSEELLPDDRDLELEEQVDIQTAWQFLRQHLDRRADDPTSRYNASM